MGSRNYINNYDLLIILLIIVVGSALIFRHTGNAEYIQIISDKGMTLYPIYIDQIIESDLKYPSKIEIKDRRVRVIEAHCPNKICEGMGWIDKAGDSIVCVPDRLQINLIGDKKGMVDAVTQ